MTGSTAPKKLTLRRSATILAALGALVMSSGVALMVAASPANAANKVGICHATSSDTNPYTYISVDDDSAKLKGHLEHRANPNKTWKDAGTFNGVPHAAGAPKPDLIGSFTDDQGVFHLYDGNITEASCASANPVLESTADVEFFDPTCEFPTRAEYDTIGDNVTFSIKSGSATPGSSIVVTAVADGGSTFDGGDTFKDFAHTFGPALDPNAPPCVVVNPPDVSTASVQFLDATCEFPNRASYETSGDNVTFSIKSGSATPGSSIVVTAQADQGSVFDGGDTFKDFAHTFGPAVDPDAPPCVVVNPPDGVAKAGVTFVDPSCENSNVASYETSGDFVTFELTSGAAEPGSDIVVTAIAALGHTFDDLSSIQVFSHTFAPAADLNGDPCVVVEPPVDGTPIVDPPIVNPPAATPIVATPTVVHSGLVAEDLRGQQGLVLLGAGMALMLLAGGLGLGSTRARS